MAGFHDIIGHEKIIEHFQQSIQLKKVSHAYILTGEEGMGKKTLVKAFAMTLLCEQGGVEPCMECHSCKQFLSNNHPDVIYVTHEKPNSIGVEDIRVKINRDIMIKPYSRPYKLYIMDESQKMTVQAQNALLKTIEEPPEYAIIILLTTNDKLFLPTIISRCVNLKLKPIYEKVIKNYLMETLNIADNKADICTAFARGNLGKAIGLATSEEFNLMRKLVLYLLKHIKEMDISDLIDAIGKINEQKLDIYKCLDFMQLWYRDVLMFKVTKDINLLIFKDEYTEINDIGNKSAFDGLETIIHAIDKAKVRLNANVNMELTLELMLLDMKEN